MSETRSEGGLVVTRLSSMDAVAKARAIMDDMADPIRAAVEEADGSLTTIEDYVKEYAKDVRAALGAIESRLDDLNEAVAEFIEEATSDA